MLPARWAIDGDIGRLVRHDGPDSAKVIQMQVGIDNGGNGFIRMFPQFGNRTLSGCREPAAIDHDNAVVSLNKPVVRVANEFRGVNPRSQFAKDWFLSLLKLQ